MRLFYFLFFTFLGYNLHAQIKGDIKDIDGKPVIAATVVLIKSYDSSIVHSAVSNSNGMYQLNINTKGNFLIKASSIGFKDLYAEDFDYNGTSIELPTVTLLKKTGDLQGVVVKASKPVIEVKADKMIFNIESSPGAAGLDGIELLRLSPGVLVDHEDNISIAGKSGVQVFIDGKPSPLSSKDLAAFLKSMRSTAIESIEIINNPSAKYDAAGTGGIINIKLKKSTSTGTNGSVSSDYQQGKWARFNNGFALNNRNQAANFFGNYNYTHATNEFTLDIYRNILDTVFIDHNPNISQTGSHNFKAGVDRFINKFNSLGFLITGNISTINSTSNGITDIKSASTNITDRVLISNNRGINDRNTLNGNINYQYNDKGKTLNMDADYGRFRMTNEQFQPNEFYNAPQTIKLSERNYTMVTPSDIDIVSFKADYEQDLLKGRLALGLKAAYVNSDNIFNSYNHKNSKLEYDSVLSNEFLYRENINALYSSFNKGFKNFQIMFGLRLEQTITKGTSIGFKRNSNGFIDHEEKFDRNLLNLFPSGNITYTKNPKSQWTLSYSRRINRPSYNDLNPFEKRGSEYGGFKGNPLLKPEFANTFSLINVYKSKLVSNLSYTIIDDVIVSISDTLDGTKSFYLPKNLAQQRNLSLNVNYSYSKKRITINTGVTGFYTHNTADFGPGRKVDLKVAAFTSFIQPNIKFDKGWSTNFRANFESPKLFRGTMKQRSFYAVNIGVQKLLFEERSTLRVNFNDVFKTAVFFGTSDFAGQYLTARAWWDPRRVVVSFNYRFGSNQIKSSRQRRSGIDEEARRTEGSN